MSGVVVWRGFYLADKFIAYQCIKGRVSLTRCRAKRRKIKLMSQRVVDQAADLVGAERFF